MSIETNPPAKGEAIDLLTAESRQRFAESYPEVPHKLQHNLHRHPLLEFERLAQLAEQGALTMDLAPDALTSSVLNQYLRVKERAMV